MRTSAAMKEVMVLRVSAATAKMTAATNTVFGMPNTRSELRWALQMTGPKRSASAQGMYRARRIPTDTPRMGITETMVAPKNLPRRKSERFKGVENTICQVFCAKSRAAAELTKAVVISNVKKDAIA